METLTIEQKAMELAEHDFLHAPIQWILETYAPGHDPSKDTIQKALDDAWNALLEEHKARKPRQIELAHSLLMGETS